MTWPAVPARAGGRALALQFQLAQSEWWSPARLQRAQLDQLLGLFRHGKSEVPWVKATLEARGVSLARRLEWEDFQQLPVLRRDEVQELGSRLHAATVPESHGRVSTSSTSGSTGRPLTVRKTSLAFAMWRALNARDHLWHGRDLQATMAQIRDISDDRAGPPDGLRTPGWGIEVDEVFQTGVTWSMAVSASIREQAAWLNRLRPTYLLVYPSVLAGLLTIWADWGIAPRGIAQVRTFGESIPDGLRDRVERMLRAPLIDVYSTGELGVLAIECPSSSTGMHVQSEGAIVEVLRPDGTAAQPGEIGEVVATPLHNFAMPLIRYAVGDFAEVGLPCPCGRGLPVIDRVMGRVRNLLLRPDGSMVWPGLGAIDLHHIAPIRQWQIRQVEVDHLEMSLVLHGEMTSDEEDAVRAAVHGPLGDWFTLTIRFVDAIALGARGKFEDFIGLTTSSPSP